jgi:hypothetical protein
MRRKKNETGAFQKKFMEQTGVIYILSPESLDLLCEIPCTSRGMEACDIVELACAIIDAGFDPKNMALRALDNTTLITDWVPSGSAVLLTTSKQDYPGAADGSEKKGTFSIMIPDGTIISMQCASALEFFDRVRNRFSVKEYRIVEPKVPGTLFRLVMQHAPEFSTARLIFPDGVSIGKAIVNHIDGTPADIFIQRVSWELLEPFEFEGWQLDRDTVYPGDECKLILKK